MKNNKKKVKKSKAKGDFPNMYLEKYIDTLHISGSEKEMRKFKKDFYNPEQGQSFLDMLLSIEKEMGGKYDGYVTFGFGFFNKSKTGLSCDFHPLSINSRDLLKGLCGKFPELKFTHVRTISLLSREKIGFENGVVVDYDDDDEYEDEGQNMTVCVRQY